MTNPQVIEKLDLSTYARGRHDLWFRATETGIGGHVDVPVVVIKGSDGPTVFIQAALHGDELAGISVIHGLLDELHADGLRGTVVAIPGANPSGMMAHSRHARSSNEGLTLTDLNREMPGVPDHKDPNARFAHALWSRLYAGQADIFLDLHTMTHGNTFPFFIFADRRVPLVDHLVKLFPADQIKDDAGEAGTVETEMVAAGVAAMTLELGGPKTCEKTMTERCLQGVRNVLIDQNMMDGVINAPQSTAFEGDTFDDIRATRGGFGEMLVELNDDVFQGQVIARQRDAFGYLIAEYTAPHDSKVVATSTDPIREPGSLMVRLLR